MLPPREHLLGLDDRALSRQRILQFLRCWGVSGVFVAPSLLGRVQADDDMRDAVVARRYRALRPVVLLDERVALVGGTVSESLLIFFRPAQHLNNRYDADRV